MQITQLNELIYIYQEVIVMCESLDRMREEARAEGKIQGEKTALRILTNLLKKGISDSYILEITGVSSELLMKAKQTLN